MSEVNFRLLELTEIHADNLACCDGRHLVGEHHHDHGEAMPKDVRRTPAKRPNTPSTSIRGWSMRSRSRRESEVSTSTARKASSIFRRGDDESLRSRSAMGNDESTRTISPAPRMAS
jgi:hypothetical protein